MLRERARLIAIGFFVADLLLVSAAFFAAYWVRGVLLPNLGITGPLHPLAAYLPLLPLALVIWAMVLAFSDRYHSHRTASWPREVLDVVRLGVLATLMFALSIYLFRVDALLLGNRTGSALYVDEPSASSVVERPSASGTTINWRAAANRDGGYYRLYAAAEGEEIKMISEHPATAGMTDYSVILPEIEGSTYIYELRYVGPGGREQVLQSLLVHDLISRMLILLFSVIAAVLILGETLLVRGFAHVVRRRGYNYRQVIIVGTGPAAQDIARSIESHRYWGLRVLGFVTVDDASPALSTPVLGSQADLPRLAEETVVDEVIFAAARQRFDDLEDLVLELEELGIATCFALNLFPNTRAKAHLADMGGTPMVTFTTGPTNQGHLFLKRTVDFVASVFALVVLSPLIALISLLIKATSRGPVLFRQQRCGLNGRPFMLHKFRTMLEGSETRQAALRDLNEMRGPVFKLAQDPRVTPIGRLLRKFSLDELPQLWNVLRGDMSLVGPRPPVPEEVAQYERWQRRRLSMRPGLTCLWQVSGRNRVDFDRWMELDLEYIDSWSPRLDLKILLKTIPAVISGRGAS